MKVKLATSIVHPYTLMGINFLLLVLLYSSLKVTWIFLNPANHFSESVELWEGYGTILVGFGVLLEERSSLRHILGATANDSSSVEEVCHDYGVILVLIGIVVEICAWLVKIPNEVLDTYGVEFTLLNIGAVVAALGGILQFKFFYDMFRAQRQQ
jgi:hypothetical protein